MCLQGRCTCLIYSTQFYFDGSCFLIPMTCVIINLIFFFNLPFRCLHLPPIYSETWILCSLNLYFLWLYVLFYHFCQYFHENNVKLSYTYVISAQFVNYTFKLRINWHAAAVLSILNWTLSKHVIFSYNFLYMLSSYTLYVMNSRVPFLSYQPQSILTIQWPGLDQCQ
jgi:hypothetical protein